MIAPEEQFWMPAAKSPEFRRRAMELARRRGQPMAANAADLGIGESYLRRWMEKDDIDADRAEGLSTDDLQAAREPLDLRHGGTEVLENLHLRGKDRSHRGVDRDPAPDMAGCIRAARRWATDAVDPWPWRSH